MEPEVNDEFLLAPRGRKDIINSKRLILERGKGVDHSGNEDLACPAYYDDFIEVASTDGHKRIHKGLSAAVLGEVRCLLARSECRSVSGDEARAEKVFTNSGTVAP